MIEAASYAPDWLEAWNGLNCEARNGHFLFDRGYMDYHADRFADASLIFTEGDRLAALFPANRREDAVISHEGLTFGGLVLADETRAAATLAVFEALLTRLRADGVKRLVYKPLPWIYHRRPAQDDLYALFRHGARLTRRDVTTLISYDAPGARSSRRERGVKKAKKAELAFGPSERWANYWALLAEVLKERHEVRPTHSLDEIQLLADRFPDAVRLFTAEQGAELVAGVVIYESDVVAHAQYIASGDRGRETGALDGLFTMLIESYRGRKRRFDFGISNEEGGRILNEGLVGYKEEFGGTTGVHDVYEIDL